MALYVKIFLIIKHFEFVIIINALSFMVAKDTIIIYHLDILFLSW